jgi:hypothetical protein
VVNARFNLDAVVVLDAGAALGVGNMPDIRPDMSGHCPRNCLTLNDLELHELADLRNAATFHLFDCLFNRLVCIPG